MFNGKEVRIFLKGQAKDAFIELKKRDDKEAKILLSSLARIKEILKDNPQFGDPISKDKIPKEFKKIGVRNLYRVELSNYWRGLYTLEGNTLEIFLFVLNMVNHKDYNRIFGYK